MANLIITVIAIALVAAASLMGAYFGGAAFLEGRDDADRANCDNRFSQEDGAINLFQANSVANAQPASRSDLTGSTPPYLSTAVYTGAPTNTTAGNVGTQCDAHPNAFNADVAGFQL